MRGYATIALGIWAGLSGMAMAQSAASPVVVELYTSQGCSSCPPADDVLQQLSTRSDVLPLSLHVDYWDYLGWKDSFGNPAYSKRQRAYAAFAGARSVYTPQMVVGGTDNIVGVNRAELADSIRNHGAKEHLVTLRVTRDGGHVRISAGAAKALPNGSVIQLVRYRPTQDVSIERGENAGRTITYTNVVESWKTISDWDGNAALDMVADLPGDASTAVIVQEPGPGAILAAAALR